METEPSKAHFAHWSNGVSKSHTGRSLALVEARKDDFRVINMNISRNLVVYGVLFMLNKGEWF